MPEDDEEIIEDNQDTVDPIPSGSDELLYALAQALRTKRSRDALATLIQQYADQIPISAKRRHTAMLWSYAFTLLILAVVGVLGWLKIVTNETAATLLGTVIGGIFYGKRSS